jgi:hypothetical protein
MSTAAEICHTQVYCAPKTGSKKRDLVREVIGNLVHHQPCWWNSGGFMCRVLTGSPGKVHAGMMFLQRQPRIWLQLESQMCGCLHPVTPWLLKVKQQHKVLCTELNYSSPLAASSSQIMRRLVFRTWLAFCSTFGPNCDATAWRIYWV